MKRSPSGLWVPPSVGEEVPRSAALCAYTDARMAFKQWEHTAHASVVPAAATSTPLVFAADWHTAEGSDENALTDGGRMDSSSNANNPVAGRLAVISAAGLDFPPTMARVLAIRYEASIGTYCAVRVANGWPLPSIGGVLCRRMYFRMGVEGPLDNPSTRHHPVQSAFDAGDCPDRAEWVMKQHTNLDFEFATLDEGNGGVDAHRWTGVGLQRHTTYRMEERFERTEATRYRYYVRVFNSSNQQIYSSSNFTCSQHQSHTDDLQGFSDGGGTIRIIDDVSQGECLRHLFICNQGIGANGIGSDIAETNRIYYGGFAVSLTDWCGAYVLGEGPP